MDEKELWEKYGSLQKGKQFPIGPHYSYQFASSPRHILFSLSRYKFASKMIGPGKRILELGCSDGLGTYFLAEFAELTLGVDFDEESVEWAQKNLGNDKLKFQRGNFLGQAFGSFDAIVAYDVIEHIYPENDAEFYRTVLLNLGDKGVLLLGTPNIESQKFSKPHVAGAHVNLYSEGRLQETLGNYFDHVFVFSQNDEMVHTGFSPLAHYLVALCCGKKVKNG